MKISIFSVLNSELIANIPLDSRLQVLRQALAHCSDSPIQRIADGSFLATECLAVFFGLFIGGIKYGYFGALVVMAVFVMAATVLFAIIYNFLARRHLKFFLKTAEGRNLIKELAKNTEKKRQPIARP